MCKVMEELVAERQKMYAAQIALKLLESAKLSYDEIAKTCNLTIDEVEDLAKDYLSMPV